MGEQDPDLLKIGFVLIKMLGFREAFFKKIPKAVLVLVIAVPPGVCLAISAQEIFSTRCEVKCFSENVFVLAGFTQVLAKLLTCVCLGNSFGYFVSNSDKYWNIDDIGDSELRKKTRKLLVWTYNSQIAYTIVCLTSVILTHFLPLAYEDGRLPLLRYSHIDDSLYFYVYAVKMLSAPIVFLVVTAADLIYIGLCITVAAQFRIVCYFMENEVLATTNDERAIQKKLSDFVAQHNFLLNVRDKISATFSFVLLIQYLTAIGIMCTELMLLSESYDSDMLINYTAELCQTAVYCFLADVVTSEAQAVAESAYNSNWYRESPKVQKSVAFVLARSQRPTTFKAAGLINVNISTFSAIVNASYSYFTLLRAYQQKEERA